MDFEAPWHLSANSLISSFPSTSFVGVDDTNCISSFAEVLASSMREASSWGLGRPRDLCGREK